MFTPPAALPWLPLSMALLLASLAGTALAQSVTLAGMLGAKVLVIVDDSAPKSLAVGETYRGVKVIATQGDKATLEIAGKHYTMRVGDAPASVGAKPGATPGMGSSGNRITLVASTGGHFVTAGQINGRAVQLVVDTGATSVSISAEEAEHIGLNYKTGQQVRLATANGSTIGWRVKLASMRVGDVEVYEVDAVVTSGAMPYVLLGNSFLTRFQMTRENDQMVLVKRY